MPFVVDPTASSLSGDDVLNEAIQLFMSGRNEELNKLTSSAVAGATSLQFTYDLSGIKAGSTLEIDTEAFRVWRTDGQNAIVEPGMAGTTQANHSAGSLVRVNPRITRAAAFRALNAELRALSAVGLYAMAYVEFPYDSSMTYELPGVSDLTHVYKVSQRMPGSKDWRDLRDWRPESNANTTDFPSGHSIFLPSAFTGQTVRVLYRSKFQPLVEPSDDLGQTAGCPPEMFDILTYGVLLRLGPVREIKRNFTESQGDARRAGEVPPNATTTSFSFVRQFREQRITEEKRRLARLYPEWRP